MGCGRTEVYARRLPDTSVVLTVDAGRGEDAGIPDAGCTGGCADCTREGYRDALHYRTIAACAGGFTVPGVLDAGATCGRLAGNDGPDPSGQGCSIEDLCAPGWHLCRTPTEVLAAAPDGCASVAFESAFFVTAQSGPGCGHCATGTTAGCTGETCTAGCAPNADTANDVFGCGGDGDAPQPSCGAFNRFSNNICTQVDSLWSCGTDGLREAYALVKTAGPGGALCCRD